MKWILLFLLPSGTQPGFPLWFLVMRMGEAKQKSWEGQPSTLDPALSTQSPASQKYKEHSLLPRPGKTSPAASTTGGSRSPEMALRLDTVLKRSLPLASKSLNQSCIPKLLINIWHQAKWLHSIYVCVFYIPQIKWKSIETLLQMRRL